MSSSEHGNAQGNPVGYPADWDTRALRRNWLDHLQDLIEEQEASIPLKRIEYQLEQSTVYHDIMQRWPKMDGSQRLKAWKLLLEYSEQAARDILPTCVQCGECCRRGSPTLHIEDLELLKEGRISWDQLVTLRQGEPVRSPLQPKIFFLLDERIKLREKPETQECVFLESSTDRCSIYTDRPLQCRAQACWDGSAAKQLAEQAYLTRRDLFAHVELLLDVIAKHHERCSFAKLQEAVKRVEQDGENAAHKLVELLAYEDHFRNFFSEQFNIPRDNLDLIFGRSFAELVPIFGLQVEVEADGTRRLVPDRAR